MNKEGVQNQKSVVKINSFGGKGINAKIDSSLIKGRIRT